MQETRVIQPENNIPVNLVLSLDADTVRSTLLVLFFHLVLIPALWGQWYNYFRRETGEEIKAVTCLVSSSRRQVESSGNLSQPDSSVHAIHQGAVLKWSLKGETQRITVLQG